MLPGNIGHNHPIGPEEDIRGLPVVRKVLESIAAVIFWLSLTKTQSEANPNNNLMMRQAGRHVMGKETNFYPFFVLKKLDVICGSKT